jgi:hypothetical protein
VSKDVRVPIEYSYGLFLKPRVYAADQEDGINAERRKKREKRYLEHLGMAGARLKWRWLSAIAPSATSISRRILTGLVRLKRRDGLR